MRNDDDLFEGIAKLEAILGENYKAVDTFNDFSLKYYYKHKLKIYKTNEEERLQCYRTFNRWVDIYYKR